MKRRSITKKGMLGFLLVVLAVLFAGCPPVPDPAVRYICFGDSATAGFPPDTYPAYLEQALVANQGEEPGSVANQGQVGDMACLSYGRLQERIDDTLYPNAHTVLYWMGGNDLFYFLYERYSQLDLNHGPLPGEISEIQAFAECIRHAAGIIRSESLAVIVGTYFQIIPGKPITGIDDPQGLTPEQAVFANQYVDVLNDAILDMAQDEGIPVAPIHLLGVLCGSPDCYHDGMHPKELGYQLVADVWYQAIVAASR